LLHVLLFLRKDPSTLNLLLMTPEPPRLVTIRTGMKTKVLWREVTPHYRLLSLILRLKSRKEVETHGRLDFLEYI
jgi:hypothetical protein